MFELLITLEVCGAGGKQSLPEWKPTVVNFILEA